MLKVRKSYKKVGIIIVFKPFIFLKIKKIDGTLL